MPSCPKCEIQRGDLSTACPICGHKAAQAKPTAPEKSPVSPKPTSCRLIACKGCGAVFSQGARQCPHCGHSVNQPRWMTGYLVFIGFIILLQITMCSSVKTKHKQAHPGNIAYTNIQYSYVQYKDIKRKLNAYPDNSTELQRQTYMDRVRNSYTDIWVDWIGIVSNVRKKPDDNYLSVCQLDMEYLSPSDDSLYGAIITGIGSGLGVYHAEFDIPSGSAEQINKRDKIQVKGRIARLSGNLQVELSDIQQLTILK